MEEGHTIMDIITMTIIVTRKYKTNSPKHATPKFMQTLE